MKTIYECSQSKGIKWMTAIFFLIIVIAILLEILYVSKGANLTEAVIVTIILLTVPASCFFVFPLYIISDEEGIGIKTLARTIRIAYKDIEHIERIDEKKRIMSASNTIRLFGIGGVFGYIGWFRTKGIGTYLSYVTDPKKVFIIYRAKGKPIAISVSHPDEFLPYYLKGGSK